MLPLQTEEVLSPGNPPRHHAKGWVLSRCGAGVWVPWCGDTGFTLPRLVYALDGLCVSWSAGVHCGVICMEVQEW